MSCYKHVYYSPLDLFELLEINLLGCPWLSSFLPYKFSNLSVTVFLIITIATYIVIFIKKTDGLVSNKLSYTIIMFFNILKNILREILITEKNIHLIIFFLLFLMLLISNLSGILPYSLSVTSHFSVTFTLAFIFFIGFNIIGFSKHLTNIVSLFLPNGTPYPIIPFIVLIEIISYTTRIFSLAIRLFANIISGHTLLKILNTFSWTILLKGGIWYYLVIFPLILISLIIGLECAIAILQAYVFTVLLLVYLKDTLNCGH
jgi:ATP synthase subunit 6